MERKPKDEPFYVEREPINQISDIIGTWGHWQTNIALCIISVAMFSAYNGLAGSFYAPNLAFACVDNATLAANQVCF